MKKFVILTDSCSDLTLELREKYDIDYVPMHFSCDDKDYVADLDYKEISAKDFYNLMRDGKRVITAQANTAQYLEAFEKYINEGFDVLSISCSSALSASVKASYAARDELLAKYPEAKIICIDSLISSIGEGLITIKAAELRAEGKSIDEVAEWIEENKLRFNQNGCPEKLTYLKQAGRVSAASAFFGGLLNIKPIIISDAKGRNVAVEKVKGRKASLIRAAELTAEEYESSDISIGISHADCEDEAKELLAVILEKLSAKGVDTSKVNTVFTYIGPIVGASVGPGTVIAYCYGKKVTYDAED